MAFNTAVLYDVENLIGGYGRAGMLSSLSLKDIHDEILKKEIDKIAIQRAYANWSDPRLSILRGDVIELGIEPIQVFGFGRGPQKNASDIQLAIDAVDIAFTRYAVETFVIVSGDGGFSALAKKLHEYGKMVIGCAFRKTTNRIFEAVCDDFIWIDALRDGYIQAREANEFRDPILIEYAKRFKPVSVKGEDIFEEASQILSFLEENKDASHLLKNIGLNISIFSQALSYRIADFSYHRMILGFAKFVDFIRYISSDSRIKLIYKPPSQYMLLYSDSSVSGFEDVEPITELNKVHTIENYKLLLSRGIPVFRLPSSEVIFKLAHHLSQNKLVYQSLLMDEITDNLCSEYGYEQNDIRNCILSFRAAGCFMREPEDAKLPEQKLSFLCQSSEETISTLKESMYRKLEELLKNVEDDVFIEILS